MRRWLALDGLRGVAVLAVIYEHWHPGLAILSQGGAGVDVFFALSGFLITTLLLDEQGTRGRIDLPAFWMRRVIRLVPALLLMVGIVVVLALATGNGPTIQAVPWAVTYTMDIRMCCTVQGYTFTVLDHTWSLAVEEQFYLIWPVILYVTFAAKLRWRAFRWLLALAILDTVYQGVMTLWINSQRSYFGPDSHAFGLLFGCAAAYWCKEHPAAGHPKLAHAISLLAGLGIIACFNAPAGAYVWRSLILGVVAFLTVVIVSQVVVQPGGITQRFLEARWIRWVGVRSYGLYLYHYMLVAGWWWPATHGALQWTALAILKLGGSFAIAALSWTYLERPVQRHFRRRWVRLSSRARSVPA